MNPPTRPPQGGVVAATLAGALDLIAVFGGGTVEGYPENADSVPAGFLYNGALSTYEKLGFTRGGRDRRVLRRSSPKPSAPRTTRALCGGRGNGQEIAAFTSSTTFFSTTELHFTSAYDTGHMSWSSPRFAASWKPRVEYR